MSTRGLYGFRKNGQDKLTFFQNMKTGYITAMLDAMKNTSYWMDLQRTIRICGGEE